MAEFVKVVRAANAMCNSFAKCSECPMTVTAKGCALASVGDWSEEDELEEIVMEWLEGKK